MSPLCFRKLITYYREQQGKTRDELVVLDKARLVTRAEAEIYLMQRIRAVNALHAFKEQSDARESGLLEKINALESELNVLSKRQANTTLNKSEEHRTRFSKEELFGAEEHVIKMVVERGLEGNEATILMAISNLPDSKIKSLIASYKNVDESVTVILMRLEKLGLIDVGGEEVIVTRSGYVVLDRIRKRLAKNA